MLHGNCERRLNVAPSAGSWNENGRPEDRAAETVLHLGAACQSMLRKRIGSEPVTIV